MFDFNDVCNIMMPMLGYYDLYKDKDLNEYRKELGLSRLNYSLNRKFSGNYIKANDMDITICLDEAIFKYIRDGKIKVYKDEETGTVTSIFNLNKKQCSKEISEYSSIYGFEQVREIRKHIRGLVKKKELVFDENKTLATYL